jgi:hypothetical protein
MKCFSVGDRVVIRFGARQGLKGTIIERQPAHVYKVKMEDGAVLFFTEKGLKGETEPVQEVVG